MKMGETRVKLGETKNFTPHLVFHEVASKGQMSPQVNVDNIATVLFI